jgi:hypothetical protein
MYRDTQLVSDLREVLTMPRTAPVVAVLTSLLVVSGSVSTVRFDASWQHNPARPWVENLKRDLATAPKGTVVYDQEVPAGVAWALLYPYNQLSELVAPLPDPPGFLAAGATSTNLAITDASGHLRQADVQGISAAPGPVRNGCGWLLGPAPTRVAMSATTFGWTWVLRMRYIASADATVTMYAGQTMQTLVLHRGVNQIYTVVSGAISAVDFNPVTNGATICTNDLTVGAAVPIAGTTP